MPQAATLVVDSFYTMGSVDQLPSPNSRPGLLDADFS